MKGKSVYITPPPEKNNTASHALPPLQDYELLVTGCAHLCKNYRLLYSYRNLLTQLESIMTYNHTILSHCLLGCKSPTAQSTKPNAAFRSIKWGKLLHAYPIQSPKAKLR